MDEENTKPVDKELEQTAGVMHKIGIGCVVVIGAPFLIGGLIFLSIGLSGNNDTGLAMRFFSLLAGIVLVLLFCALMYKQLKSRKSIEAGLKIKQQFPREPWMWREDWAQGEIWDYTPQRLIKLWMPVAGIGVFVLATPFIISTSNLGQYFDTYPFLVYGSVAAVIVGAFLSVRRALLETARVKKFGRSEFQMSEVPAFLGGRMRGKVETTLPEIPQIGVSVHFENVTFGVGFGNRDEGEMMKVHCSTDVNVPAEELSRGPKGVVVPIDLPISKDGRPYENRSENRRDRWRLIVSASIPGVDYRAEFHPPVWDLGEDGLVKDDFTDIAI